MWRITLTPSAAGSGTVAGAGTDTGASDSTDGTQWTSIALVLNSATERALYVNGNLVATDTNNRTPTGLNRFTIGDYGGKWATDGYNNYFNGIIDDVRLYNRALSAGEIQGLYSGLCSSPFGPAGTMIYNQDAHVMQFCDGRSWVAMGPAGDGGAGCVNPAGVEGEMDYNDTWKTMQYCEGDQWIGIGKRCSTPLCGGSTTEKIVFIKQGIQPDDIDGVGGGDIICQTEANAYSLRGTYKIWLAGNDPASAPATRFIRSSVPYKRVDGVTVADNWADLTDGTLDANLNIMADGLPTTVGNSVWSNVQTDGTQIGTTNTCVDWTTTVSGNGAFGLKAAVNSTWTNSSTISCGASSRVYCFEQ